MKKLLPLLMLGILGPVLITGCDDFDDCEEHGDSKTTVTISNQSGMTVTIETFAFFYRHPGLVVTSLLDGESEQIKVGCGVTLYAWDNLDLVEKYTFDHEDETWVITGGI